jgi:pimeloyl-ACP methyl ester carboxylesterase
VDDFAEVLAWLGYRKINVIGGSYGTRTGQVFARRHPEQVRTVTLAGAVPMDEHLPITHAAAGQRSFDLLASWCEKDPACHGKFPEFRQEFQSMMDRLRREPVTVEVQHPKTDKPVQVKIAWNVVADGVRWALYDPRASALLPWMIHQAATGDFTPIAQASIRSRLNAIDFLTMGLFFSVTCAEDIPFIDPSQIPARTAGSFLGDYRVRQQVAACGVWPRAAVAPEHREALRSDAPMLLVSGERDPVTPPAFAERAARQLTHAMRIVVPFAGHGGGDPCVEAIGTKFLEKGSGEGLDTSCLKGIRLTPFVLEKPKGETAPG